MPLTEVLQILELKTKFTFSYLNKELPLSERVTLDAQDKSLQQILEILSQRYALTFTRINNIIIIKKKEGAEEKKIPQGVGILRGIVRDSLTSEVLPYAHIYIKEINTAVGSDNRGYFIISSLPAKKEYTVVVTFVGYSPKLIKTSIEQSEITHVDIALAKSAIEVNNVYVFGERVAEEEVTVRKFSITDIQNITQGVETDVMRSIQFEPGVQSAGPSSGISPRLISPFTPVGRVASIRLSTPTVRTCEVFPYCDVM